MKKTKLLISVISVCFALAVLCFGVYAAHQISYDLSGTLTYRVYDVYMNVETSVYYSPTHLSQEQIYTKIDSIINSETPNYTTLGLTAESTPAGLSYYYNQEELVNGAISRNLNFAFSNEDNPKLAFFVVFTVSNHSTVPIRAGVNAPQTTPTNVYSVTSGLWNKIQKGSPKRLVVAMSIENVDAPIPVTNASNYHLNLYAQNLTEAEENAPSNVYGDFIFEDGAISASRSLKSATKDLYIPSFIDGEKVTECVNFQNCKNLTSIYVPTSVELMTQNLFAGCTSVETLSVPFIGRRNCSSLDEMDIDYKNYEFDTMYVSPIGNYFDYEENDNSYFYSYDDGSCYVPKSLTSVNILYGCKVIGYGAFSNIGNPDVEFGIYNISLPSSLVEIGEMICDGSKWLEENLESDGLAILTATDGVTKYLMKAGEDITDLTYSDLAGVKIISGYAFDCCSLESIQIPNSVTYISNWALSYLSDLTSVTFESNSSLIGMGYHVFDCCTSLTSITIPASVQYIGKGIFSGCTALTNITVEGANEHFDSRNNCKAIINSDTNELVAGCKNTVIPATVTRIGDGAFRDISTLTSITVPSGVTSIGEYAFFSTGLTSITIPVGVLRLEDEAFSHCESLATVSLPSSLEYMDHPFYDTLWMNNLTFDANDLEIASAFDNSNVKFLLQAQYNFSPANGSVTSSMMNGVKIIDSYAFGGVSNVTSIYLPNTLTCVGRSALRSFRLTSLSIPSSVKYWSEEVLGYNNSLNYITVDAGNTNYDSRNGCNALIETATNKLIIGCKNTVIPNGVVEIEMLAFAGCDITSISIPNSVTTIDHEAFQGCSNLQSVSLSNNLDCIKMSVFVNCVSLSEVVIPGNIKFIQRDAFYGCSGLTSVTLLSSIPTILTGLVVNMNTFDNTNNCLIYVPQESLVDYLEAPGWSQYADRIRPIED